TNFEVSARARRMGMSRSYLARSVVGLSRTEVARVLRGYTRARIADANSLRDGYQPRYRLMRIDVKPLSLLPEPERERVAGGAKALGPEALARALRHRRWRAVHARRSRP